LESDLVMIRLRLYDGERERTRTYAIVSYVVGAILMVISIIDVNR